MCPETSLFDGRIPRCSQPMISCGLPRLTDPDDDMVLETAINGGASAIVTFNQHDFAGAGRDFGCVIILPVTALQRIRSLMP